MLTDKELEHHSNELWKLFLAYVEEHGIATKTVGVLVVTDYPVPVNDKIDQLRTVIMSPLPPMTSARLLSTAAGAKLKELQGANRAKR